MDEMVSGSATKGLHLHRSSVRGSAGGLLLTHGGNRRADGARRDHSRCQAAGPVAVDPARRLRPLHWRRFSRGLAGLLLATPAAATIGEIVHVLDPVAYAVSLLIIIAACLVAASIPATRAARLDPTRALRQE